MWWEIMKKIKITKKSIIISIMILVALNIILSACDTSVEDNKPKETPKKTDIITVKETPKKTPKKTEKKTKETKVLTPTKPTSYDKTNLNLAISLFETSFSNIADIKYESKDNSINIIPRDSQVMLDILEAKKGNQVCKSYWDELVLNLVSSSETTLCKDIRIKLINSLNTDNAVLIILNGTVLYNEVSSVAR
jgi:type IV secretory pathway VirB10-like protein